MSGEATVRRRGTASRRPLRSAPRLHDLAGGELVTSGVDGRNGVAWKPERLGEAGGDGHLARGWARRTRLSEGCERLRSAPRWKTCSRRLSSKRAVQSNTSALTQTETVRSETRNDGVEAGFLRTDISLKVQTPSGTRPSASISCKGRGQEVADVRLG